MQDIQQTVSGMLLAMLLLTMGCNGNKDRPPRTATFPKASQRMDPNDQTFGFSEGLGRVELGGKRGFIDKTGRLVIQPQFEKAWDFSCGRAMIEKDGKRGYIDPTGRPVIEPRFPDARSFSEGLAGVRKDALWGFIDPSGKFAILPKFEDMDRGFSEGLAAVGADGLYGFIDKTGKFVVKPRYDNATNMLRGRAAVRKGKYWAYINKEGKEVTPFIFASTVGFGKDPCVAYVNIPTASTWFMPNDPNDKTGTIALGVKTCFIDPNGKIVFNPPPGVDVGFFNEGLCMAIDRTSGQFLGCGYMDLSGKWVVKPQYEAASLMFSEGMGAVKLEGRWGYVNRSGTMVIKPSFELALPFQGGFARVAVKGSWGYIDPNGNLVWKPTR